MKILGYDHNSERVSWHKWGWLAWGYSRNYAFYHAHLEVWRVRFYISWRRRGS